MFLVASGGEGAPTFWLEVRPSASVTPKGPSPVMGAVVGALVAVLLVWRGHRVAAAALAVVVVTLVGARRTSPTFDRWIEVGLTRLARVVGTVLTWLCLGFLVVVVILPAWAVTTVLRWNTLEPAPRRGWWAVRRLRPWQERPDRGFADERRSLPWQNRLHGLAVVTVPLVVLLLMAFPLRSQTVGLAERVRSGDLFVDSLPEQAQEGSQGTAPVREIGEIADPVGDAPDGQPRDTSLAQRGLPYAGELFQELQQVEFAYDPYLTVRVADRTGQYVNVIDRVRRSYVPVGAAQDPAALDVWFLGSSALFGWGQRDEHTIPSEVARIAEDAGVPLRVHNLGVPSFWAWQDDLLLAQLLSERPPPDLIVSYEGYNDVIGTLPRGSPTQVSTGLADQVRSALLDAGADFRGGHNSAVDPIPRTTATSPANAATVFGRSARLARDLARSRDIPIAQFLQPAVWSRDLAVDDATLSNIGADREWHDSYAMGWNMARTLMATGGVVDLGDSLDTYDEVVYSDDVHTNEAASRVVASALFAEIAPTLEQLRDAKARSTRG